MEVEVIQQTVTPQAFKSLKAEVEALRRDGCDKAEDNELTLLDIKKDIDKIKKKIEVSE